MRIGIYCTSISGDNPESNAFIQELKGSGFNTVVIWTLFVHSDGTIMWNGEPLVQNGQLQVPWLPGMITTLKAPPTTVDTVLFSIGAGGSLNDPNKTWTRIKHLLEDPSTAPMFTTNLQALASSVPVDGFDFDDEDFYEEFGVTQTAKIFNTPTPRTITFCPYTMESFWISCLADLYRWAQEQNPPREQPVQWLNLQCYVGGTNTNAPAQVQTFASAISGAAGRVGVPYSYYGTYAREFIVPGLSATGTDYSTYPASTIPYTPYDIEVSFSGLSGVGGGWLWNSSSIPSGYTLQDYAQAIINGLNEASASAKLRKAQPPEAAPAADAEA